MMYVFEGLDDTPLDKNARKLTVREIDIQCKAVPRRKYSPATTTDFRLMLSLLIDAVVSIAIAAAIYVLTGSIFLSAAIVPSLTFIVVLIHTYLWDKRMFINVAHNLATLLSLCLPLPVTLR